MANRKQIHGWDEKLEPIFSGAAQDWAARLRCDTKVTVKTIFLGVCVAAEKRGWKVPSLSTFRRFIKRVDAAAKSFQAADSLALRSGAPEKEN